MSLPDHDPCPGHLLLVEENRGGVTEEEEIMTGRQNIGAAHDWRDEDKQGSQG